MTPLAVFLMPSLPSNLFCLRNPHSSCQAGCRISCCLVRCFLSIILIGLALAGIEELERDLRETAEKELPASIIGEKIMAKLHELDDVAYVRFASVYREFKDVNDFVEELRSLLSQE